MKVESDIIISKDAIMLKNEEVQVLGVVTGVIRNLEN